MMERTFFTDEGLHLGGSKDSVSARSYIASLSVLLLDCPEARRCFFL